MRKYALCLLLLLPLLCCYLHAAPEQDLPEGLTQTSSLIREKLTDLKAQSASMTALCEELSLRLRTSQEELGQWKEQSTKLSASLTLISERLSSSYEAIIIYEQRLKRARTTLYTLIAILLVLLALKGIAYTLYFKGVPLPRWIDILL